MIEELRKRVPQEEFDYQTLLSVLGGYARPRDKITDLMRKGVIIRVKKGLYIFGDGHRRQPYSREILANLIYGPSYISLDYALQHYGMIPERVEAITSVTSGRSRRFFTPVGLFAYWGIPLSAFLSGMDRAESNNGRSFLIAIPEKALADKIQNDRGAAQRTLRDLRSYLFDNLRLDPAALHEMSLERLGEFAVRYRSRKIALLRDLARNLQRNG